MRLRAGTALPLAAAVGTLGGCSESAAPDRPAPIRAATTQPASVNPVTAFAPLVRIHPRERWFPVGARYFLANAGLEWGGGPCRFERDVAGSKAANDKEAHRVPLLDVSRLGQAPGYRSRPVSADCVGRRPVSYSTTMRTAPFYSEGRPAGLHGDEGFALDILTDAQRGPRRVDGDGALTGVPAYYARDPAKVAGRPGLRLSYWLLYGHGARPDPAGGGQLVHHEGDWERFDVLVKREGRGGSPRRYALTAVRYHSEERIVTLDWDDLELAGTHPVADAAAESHTMRPPAACRKCVDWPTWRDLRDVRRQPWFGYGGAWGATREPPAAASPPGPSPFELGHGPVAHR